MQSWLVFLFIFFSFTVHASTGETSFRLLGENSSPYGFIEYLPHSYTSKNKWPLIIMLHGSGERGNGREDLSLVMKHGPNRRIKEGRHFPAVILTPQSSGQWDVEKLRTFVDFAFKNYSLDSKRFYLTGISMGGGGTWKFLKQYPSLVAAAIPICGATTASFDLNEQRALNQIPIYAVHNWDDDDVKVDTTISYAESYGTFRQSLNSFLKNHDSGRDMTAYFYDELRTWIWMDGSRRVIDTKFTVAIDSTGGHDSWTKTYESEEIWNWLFYQVRSHSDHSLGLIN